MGRSSASNATTPAGRPRRQAGTGGQKDIIRVLAANNPAAEQILRDICGLWETGIMPASGLGWMEPVGELQRLGITGRNITRLHDIVCEGDTRLLAAVLCHSADSFARRDEAPGISLQNGQTMNPPMALLVEMQARRKGFARDVAPMAQPTSQAGPGGTKLVRTVGMRSGGAHLAG